MLGTECGLRRYEISADQGVYKVLVVDTQGTLVWCYSSRPPPSSFRLGTADKCPDPIVFMGMTQTRDLTFRTVGFESCADTFGLNEHRVVPVECLHLADKHVSALRHAFIEVSVMHLQPQRHKL